MDLLNDDSAALLQEALDTLDEDPVDDLDPLDLDLDDSGASISLDDLLDNTSEPPDLDPLSLVDGEETYDGHSSSSTDLLEEKVTAIRNGENPLMTSVSDFTSILSRTGIHGPRHLQTYNLKRRAVKIGSGGQFTVYKETPGRFFGNEGLVIKRVKVFLSREGSGSFASGSDYRNRLRSLELEVLALSNPYLRNHRNIAKLVAWGYDYPYPDTPVPVLFVEEALMTLTDLLKIDNERLLGPQPLDVKYQLLLDAVSGLEALHRLHIVHGDVKPDNILIYKDTAGSDNVPLCAKISDFGVCVDLESSEDKLTIDSYYGTEDWRAPEVSDLSRWEGAAFDPEVMFRFDSYSLGLLILSTFINRGEPVKLKSPGEEPIEVALFMLREDPSITGPLRMQIGKALRQLLATDPWKRSLASPELLKFDSPAFASWLAVAQDTRKVTANVGIIDPAHNQGPRFWYRLDPSLLADLEQQFAESQSDQSLRHAGDVLLGMAQCITGAKPSYLERLLTYITEAARSGYSPARAVYAQVMHAHGQMPAFDEQTLDKWLLQAVSEGYFFERPSTRVTKEQLQAARQRYRDAGGFCADPFTRKPTILAIAQDRSRAEEWLTADKRFVDIDGNTLLHAAAALGSIDVVQWLVGNSKMPVDVPSDNGETPLYKACQAGQIDTVHYLLDQGAASSITTRREKLTPLHWLFMFPESSTSAIATRFVKEGGADVNALMVPERTEEGAYAARRNFMAHYPFELPMGTPFHWAAFARSIPSMEVLLELGADINATYHNSDTATTALGLASWYGDLEVVRFLLSKGANGKAKDARGRNMLHLMTFHQPEYHGPLRQAWHYWIRHGSWDTHLQQMTDLVASLTLAGANIEDRDEVYPRTTAVVRAAEDGVWNGGALCALINAGADVDSPRGTSKDTVLHQWARITGPRLAYTDSYLYVLQEIVSGMACLDIRNDYVEETPLHLLVTIYHSEEEFRSACDIFFAHDPPPDVNLGDRQGLTPLLIAADTNQVTQDPEQRAIYLISKGADLEARTRENKDVFCLLANNKTLSDQQSHDIICRLLTHMATLEGCSIAQVYRKHYLPQRGALLTLSTAAMAGRVKTTALLLDVGLDEVINNVVNPKGPATVLDNTISSAEQSRHMHLDLLAAYSPGAPRARALASQTVYDPRQGPPVRAAEAYWGLPDVLQLLRGRGAKRACELVPSSHPSHVTLDHPDVWDITHMYWVGFTPETQINRERWEVVYQLSRFPSIGWRETIIDSLRDMYESDTWWPDLAMLEASINVINKHEKNFASDLVPTLSTAPSDTHTEVIDVELLRQMLRMLVTVRHGEDDVQKTDDIGDASTAMSRWIKIREGQKYDRSPTSSEALMIPEVKLVWEGTEGTGFRLGPKRVRQVD
ncbi:ankyrin repeat-containing domain protein [Aspergillus welwitschiae]|uniref:Ankyrin repeat-containing domain protein n=1 Tax=Aspergillus welwitschiae TaxID=1341132 RepID=A0A3F3PZC7_9EURO|nr:ankyrin repeat-containing domain protein [Aspergillus welwitschiae]RDH32310.1 ankyrin repeat-containing domain protein [Aspergillus welwitschiae]